MSLDAYIGETLVVQVLYLDDRGVPLAVTDPQVEVFRFNPATGAKVSLATAPLVAVEGDPGRYAYRYTVPADLTSGTVLYVEYRATDSHTGNLSVSQEIVNAYSRPAADGLRVRFTR